MARLIARLASGVATADAVAAITNVANVLDTQPVRTANAIIVVAPAESLDQVRSDLQALPQVDRVFENLQGFPQVAEPTARQEFLGQIADFENEEELPPAVEGEPTPPDDDLQSDGGSLTVPELTEEEQFPDTLAGPIESINDSLEFGGVPGLHDEGITGSSVICMNVDTGSCGDQFADERKLDGTDLTGNDNPYTDYNGHGCLAPDMEITTNFCGTASVKEIWDRLVSSSKSREPDEVGFRIGDGDVRVVDHLEGWYSTGSPIRVLGVLPDGSVESSKITDLYKFDYSGELVTVKTQSGTVIKTTPWHTHIVWTSNGFEEKRADEMSNGDLLATPGTYPSGGLTESSAGGPTIHLDMGWYLTSSRAWMVGAFVGDGHLANDTETGNYVVFSNNDAKIRDRFARISSDLTSSFTVHEDSGEVRCYGNDLPEFITSIYDGEIDWSDKSTTATIPKYLFRAKRSVIGGFVAGLLDADGFVDSDKPRVVFSTSSRKLSEQLTHLLGLVGIHSSAKVVDDKRLGDDSTKAPTTENHHVTIRGRDDLFSLAKLINSARSNPSRTSELGESNSWIGLASDDKQNRLMNRLYDSPDPKGTGKADEVRDVRLDPVEEVHIEEESTTLYDYTTEESHTYAAGKNGVVFTHNSYTLGIMAGGPETQGINRGYAPGADVWPIKTSLDAAELIQAQDVIVQLAEDSDRPLVVNNSWGFLTCSGLCDHPVTEAIRNASLHSNVYQVFAAANSARNCGQVCDGTGVGIAGPNSINEVLTVGATGMDGDPQGLMNYSSRGGPNQVSCGTKKPDVTAPIFGTVPWNCQSRNIGNGGGTSGAAPQAAGTVALMLDRQGSVPQSQVYQTLRQTATQFRGSGFNGCTGFGNMRPDEAVARAPAGGALEAGAGLPITVGLATTVVGEAIRLSLEAGR